MPGVALAGSGLPAGAAGQDRAGFAEISGVGFRDLVLAVPMARSSSHVRRRNQSSLFLRSASIAALFPVLAVIYGVAWWTIWKEKPYAKVWAIAASATYVLINLSLVHWLVSVPSCVWVMSAVGVAGLVVFLWRDHDQIPSESPD
jgi:hypothetical protein